MILTFSADAARLAYPEVGGFGVAWAAVEALTRSLAAVGNVAALMASDHVSPLTANVINVTCGEIAD